MNFSKEPGTYHYDQRTFHGPLQPDNDILLPPRLDAFKHPDDENRVVRTHVKTFDKGDALKESLGAARALLVGLEERGIPHVRPEYLDNQYDKDPDVDRPSLAIVMDRIPNSVSFQSILESGEMTEDQVREADRVIKKLADYLIDVINNGGPMSDEMLNLGQFVYAPERESGQRLVLVDVEPVACAFMSPHQYDDKTDTVLGMLLVDAATIRKIRPDIKLASLPALMMAIDYVTAGSQGGERWADMMRRSLYASDDPYLDAARNED